MTSTNEGANVEKENPVVPPKPKQRTLDSVKESAEKKLEEGVSNAAFNMKLKDVVHYIGEAQNIIKENEELRKKYNENLEQFKHANQQIVQREQQLANSQAQFNFQKQTLAHAAAREIVRTKNWFGFARKPEKIMEEYQVVHEHLLQNV